MVTARCLRNRSTDTTNPRGKMRWGSEIDDAREVAVRQETGTFALAAASDGRDNPPLKSRRRRIRSMETGKALSSAQTTGKRLKTNKFALKIDRALRAT